MNHLCALCAMIVALGCVGSFCDEPTVTYYTYTDTDGPRPVDKEHFAPKRLAFPGCTFCSPGETGSSTWQESEAGYDPSYAIWRVEKYFRFLTKGWPESWGHLDFHGVLRVKRFDSNFPPFAPYTPNHIPFALAMLREEREEGDICFLSNLLSWNCMLQLYVYTGEPYMMGGVEYMDDPTDPDFPIFARRVSPDVIQHLESRNLAVSREGDTKEELLALFSDLESLSKAPDVLERYTEYIGDETAFLSGDVDANSRTLVKYFLSYGLFLFPSYLELVYETDSDLFYTLLSAYFEEVPKVHDQGDCARIRVHPKDLLFMVRRNTPVLRVEVIAEGKLENGERRTGPSARSRAKAQELLRLWDQARPCCSKYTLFCDWMDDAAARLRARVEAIEHE